MRFLMLSTLSIAGVTLATIDVLLAAVAVDVPLEYVIGVIVVLGGVVATLYWQGRVRDKEEIERVWVREQEAEKARIESVEAVSSLATSIAELTREVAALRQENTLGGKRRSSG